MDQGAAFCAMGKEQNCFCHYSANEQPLHRLEIRRFTLIGLTILLVALIILAVGAISRSSATTLKVASLETQLLHAQHSIEELQNSTDMLVAKTAQFEEKLGQVTAVVENRAQRTASAAPTDLLAHAVFRPVYRLCTPMTK